MPENGVGKQNQKTVEAVVQMQLLSYLAQLVTGSILFSLPKICPYRFASGHKAWILICKFMCGLGAHYELLTGSAELLQLTLYLW